jgi:hypothetical protein
MSLKENSIAGPYVTKLAQLCSASMVRPYSLLKWKISIMGFRSE